MRANVAGTWNIPDQTTWNRRLPTSSGPPSEYFNTQIGGALHHTDCQTIQADRFPLIGSWKRITSLNPNSMPFWLCTAVYTSCVSSNWRQDLIYLASELTANNTESTVVRLLRTITSTP